MSQPYNVTTCGKFGYWNNPDRFSTGCCTLLKRAGAANLIPPGTICPTTAPVNGTATTGTTTGTFVILGKDCLGKKAAGD